MHIACALQQCHVSSVNARSLAIVMVFITTIVTYYYYGTERGHHYVAQMHACRSFMCTHNKLAYSYPTKHCTSIWYPF